MPRKTSLRQAKKDKARLEKDAAKLRGEKRDLVARLEEASRNNDCLRAELIRTRAELTALKPASLSVPVQVNSYAQMRSLCVMLAIAGALSFRSIPRALDILIKTGWIPSCRLPHFTSVINWTLRAGISIYNQVTELDEPWLGIVDCSIDIGVRKALVALRVPLSTVQHKGGAVTLADCECNGVKISSIWNGESAEKELSEVFGRAGRPIAIVKDQGSDLGKGVRLFDEREGTGRLQVVDDVGHVTANALKAEFSSSTEFKNVLEAVTAGSAKIRQTELASLLPPKIRSKGRFQGITRLAKWAGEILGLVSNVDSTKGDGHLVKLQTAFSGLLGLQSFIARFVEIGTVCEDFLCCMKQNGLNADSYKSAKTILARLPCDSKMAMR